MEEHDLHRKLLAVEALHDGATTEGERLAAEQARERLLQRLSSRGLLRRAGVHHAFEQAAQLGAPDAEVLVEASEAELPTTEDLLLVLAAWRLGLRRRREVCAWASELCDRLLLPVVPVDDPRAARVEVLLQLAALRQQPLSTGDVPAIEAFLQAPAGPAAWAAWFDFLGRAAATAARSRGPRSRSGRCSRTSR
ncbi:hypothetical protein L6R53_21090 [Myxococcota bacterium]|nr:hypothetical protein [Myxococcota bacterium]